MKKLKQAFPFFFTIALVVAQYGFASEETPYPSIAKPGQLSSEKAQSVIASLSLLAKVVANQTFTEDQIANIEQNIANINQILNCNQYYPVSGNNNLVSEGSCGKWHPIPCLDDSCWAVDTCNALYLNCGNVVWNSDDCCCGTALRFGSWSTLGLWPAGTGLLSCFVGLAQGLSYGSTIPFRFCGSCDEYEYKKHVNKDLLQSYIRQYAIKLKERVQEAQIPLSKENHEELERLIL